MPTVNMYLNEEELTGLLMEAKKEGLKLPVFCRKILHEWLKNKGLIKELEEEKVKCQGTARFADTNTNVTTGQP
jgi:hypothetical protein